MRSLAVTVVVERGAITILMNIMMRRKMQMESRGMDTPEYYRQVLLVWSALVAHLTLSRERYLYHARERGDTNGENVGGEVGGDLGWPRLGKNVADPAVEVENGWIDPENHR